MIDEVLIKEALIAVYERECSVLQYDVENGAPHIFSEQHVQRIQDLSRVAKRRHVTVMHRRFRLAFLVAALIAIMVAATVTTIAIVRPQIFYTVRKGLKSWDYTFRQEDPDKLAGEFEYKKPVVPEGYKIEQEEKYDDLYVVNYVFGNNRIIYEQNKFNDTLSYSITDSAKKESVTLIDGTKAELYYENVDDLDTYMLFWNDGVNIYSLTWYDCSKQEIIELAATIK